MISRTCSRQSEIQELLGRGHWPHACPPDLRMHLVDCRSCAELLLVSATFQRSRLETSAMACIPAPGAIWWRAQLRRRNAAVERVGRPILGGYIFALSIASIVAAAVVISQIRNGFRWLDWLAQSQIAERVQSLNGTATNSVGILALLIPIFAMLALLGAVVVYFAAERK